MNELKELRWWQDDLSERFDGLIFDCDGTLTNSMPLHFRAWREAMSVRGVEFPEPRFYSMGGMPTEKIIAVLSQEQNVDVDVDSAAQAKEDAFAALMDELEPLQIVCDCAARYRGILPLAVASGGNRPIIERQLKQIELFDWFDAIVTSEDTELHKPEPDAFLLAARLLGVEPTRCLVFEDSPLGFDAACRAGMQYVDVRPNLVPSGA
ncbi:HAD family hydrolase [Aporhodopirellula aestuarii]|uniref:HAD-IA family hydrolase n=1 Tax=Aporhodopirellula aestuarii TaxID=2950107 RepID=A0ABT0U0H6_9BACT|nr:HAD-IA family hydrolase [Aporhodopirellula aestuarii]MCM2370340.1 HAD-IA family hydrolase [Aporhodopirellula aestuarii]